MSNSTTITDYCDDCNAPMVWCVCISTYIQNHIYEQHDYMFAEATESGEYDICVQCDCRRYVGTDNWVVA